MLPIKFSIVRSRKQHLMALTLKINSTSGSKWRPFLKIIITRKKTVFFGGSISTSVNYIKRPLHAKFHAFNQKCTIFSHNRLTISDLKSGYYSAIRFLQCKTLSYSYFSPYMVKWRYSWMMMICLIFLSWLSNSGSYSEGVAYWS